jgi:hypothetical protein
LAKYFADAERNEKVENALEANPQTFFDNRENIGI